MPLQEKPEDIKDLILDYQRRLQSLDEQIALEGKFASADLRGEKGEIEKLLTRLRTELIELGDENIEKFTVVGREERIEHIKKLIFSYGRRIQAIRERQAFHGQNISRDVLFEIEQVSGKIDDLTIELKELGVEEVDEIDPQLRRHDIKKLIFNYQRRLQVLEEQRALYGPDTPVQISVEIRNIEGMIQTLNTEFKALDGFESTELVLTDPELRKGDIKKLIVNYQRRLQMHLEQQARMGYSTPLNISSEIESIRIELKNLGEELSALEDDTEQASQIEDDTRQKITSREDGIKELIENYQYRLRNLKLQEEVDGLDTAPNVLVEIEDIRVTIEKLQAELSSLEQVDDNQLKDAVLETRPKQTLHRDDIEQLIANHQRRLQKLKEQRALYGIVTPAEILIQIEDLEVEISNLQTQFQELVETSDDSQTHNIKEIRNQLNKGFDEPELDAMILDYFPEVYNNLSRGMRKDEKITILLDACRRQPDGYDQLQEVITSHFISSGRVTAGVNIYAQDIITGVQQNIAINLEQTDDTSVTPPSYGPPDIVATYLNIIRAQFGQVETRPYFQLSKVAGAPPRLSLIGEDGLGGVYIPLYFDKPSQTNIDLTQALKEINHLVVVGGAGSGKSTVLRYVAMVLAAQDAALNRVKLAWTTNVLPLPIFVFLRDFEHACQVRPETYQRNPDSLLRFIDDHFERWYPGRVPSGFLSDLIKTGNAWILLDGLDEVANFDHRVTIRGLLEELAAIHPKNRILITARVAAYADSRTQLNDQFSTVNIRDLTREQWQPMLRRIYAGLLSARPDIATQKAEQLTARIDSSYILQNMVKTPLMVWTATLIHFAGSELPEQRAELYAAYVDVLLGERLHEEESAEAAQSLRDERWPADDRRLYLTYAAHHVHTTAASEQDQTDQHSAHVIVDEYDLVTRILGPFMQNYLGLRQYKAQQEAEDFVAMMAERSGLLHAHETGYSFGDHLTIQEFLTACYLVENVRSTPDWSKFLQDHVGQSWWEQVFMLISGYLLQWPQQAQRFLLRELGGLPEKSDAALYGLTWAGKALLEIPASRVGWYSTVRDQLSQRLQTALSQRENNISVEARIEVGEILGVLGDVRFKGRFQLPDFINITNGTYWMGNHKSNLDYLADRIPQEQFSQQLQLSRWPEISDMTIFDIRQAFSSEFPRHQVSLDDFAIAIFPTTNAMFACFIEAGGYADKNWWVEAIAAGKWVDGKIIDPVGERIQPAYWNEVGFNGVNQPIIGVTWYEAMAYCRWITYQLRKNNVIRSNEIIRLPSEAEWERTAHSISASANDHQQNGQIYPWGDDWELGNANTEELGLDRTTPVGISACGATVEGVYDLAGNVSEWCRDWYSKNTYHHYTNQIAKNPTGAEEGKYKVLRGGSWQNNRYFVRNTFRDRENPDNRSQSIGFRLVRSFCLEKE